MYMINLTIEERFIDKYLYMDIAVFWFRRDLRLHDNAGLLHALESGKKVLPLFIFDKEILDPLPEKDARVTFIYQQVERLHRKLQEHGSGMLAVYDKPLKAWKDLVAKYNIVEVYTNKDYEPYARERDDKIQDFLSSHDISFHTYKDHVIFEKEEILTNNDTPYSVFTPYSKKWKSYFTQDHIISYESEKKRDYFLKFDQVPKIPKLEEMGFSTYDIGFPSAEVDEEIVAHYKERRNFPAQRGTTRMGIHLRFGTISIRSLARTAVHLSDTYLNELIWRDFYMQILWNYPHVADGPFRKEYAHIPWREDHEGFEQWCKGETGFPIVDAGMRELNETGYMHNRVRMITASFLVKDLLINWQWGEAYFAEKLLDYELASNNGGWQWAAGCGTDAAPYFRIFNPESQLKKFDPKMKYVQKWIPEYGTPTYPKPIINHKQARERTLEVYKEALDKS